MKPTTLTALIARLGVAGLFLFTGVFKLTGNPDAQATFAQIGGSAAMYLTGVIEVVVAAMVLWPRRRAIGSVLAMGVMAGAIVSHVAHLVPNDDMLPLAVVLFAASGWSAFVYRGELPGIGAQLAKPKAAPTA